MQNQHSISDQEQINLSHQPIDSAALAGAATAAALAAFLVPGPFVPLNGVVGLTLLIIVLTYEMKRARHRWQNLAFGGVCGLCALLVVGFVSEFLYSGLDLNYWQELENPPRSNLSQWFLFFGWASLTAVFTRLGSRFAVPVSKSAKTEYKRGKRRRMNKRTKFAAILVISGAICILFALGTSTYNKYDTNIALMTVIYGFIITFFGILLAFIHLLKGRKKPTMRNQDEAAELNPSTNPDVKEQTKSV